MNFDVRNHSLCSKSGAAALMAFAMLAGASSTWAAVQCSANNLALAVPVSTSGIYLNLVTGATATTGSAAPGWHFNPWGSNTLGFFFGGTSGGTVAQKGGVGTGALTTGPFSVLTAGMPVGVAQQFNTTTGGGAPAWQVPLTDAYFGLRFLNAATATINYGWVRMSTGATGGLPATINQYCYEDTGAQITAGTTPVSLQSFAVD